MSHARLQAGTAHNSLAEIAKAAVALLPSWTLRLVPNAANQLTIKNDM
jgi:hypothetical protein